MPLDIFTRRCLLLRGISQRSCDPSINRTPSHITRCLVSGARPGNIRLGKMIVADGQNQTVRVIWAVSRRIRVIQQKAAAVGTSIDCFFASDARWSPTALAARLDDLCATLQNDLDELRRNGQFSKSGGKWSVWGEESEQEEFTHLSGEGPAGLGIDVHQRVICLTSVERFAALYDDAYRVVSPLRRVLCSLATSLAQPAKVAIAPAGLGYTDSANDVACAGGTFEEVWKELDVEPPGDWAGLGQWSWYFGPPTTPALSGPAAG